MIRLGRFAGSRWFKTGFGVFVLCVLIWFFGPLLGVGEAHPLDSDMVRIGVIIGLVVLWLVLNLVASWQASRKDKQLMAGAAAAAASPDATASAEEIAILSDRLRDAMQALKHARLAGRSGSHLYQLPWYMFIGPPGAGKTTALANSGLQFPLADSGGPRAVQGVGGTRNCDWWLTDQAVLIDTAGRYTTQDSNDQVDAAAWTGFLRLLKKHRTRQPLNGVLLAISLSDLSELPPAQRQEHARAMRKRVRELHDELGVRMPVYVVFTKADLIAGFVEFFSGLGREEREQVWGMTLPLDEGRDEGGAVAAFAAEFDLLLARLHDRMLERLQQEPDIQRRRMIYGFPQQVASLREVAAEFLTEIFRPSRLEARPLLRGVYFTSGTQDGTPIDRLLGSLAGQFGLARQSVPAFSGAGRSYFLTRLIRDVVLAEAGLVGRDPKVEARTKWIYRGTYAGSALAVMALTAVWVSSYLGNASLVAQISGQDAAYAAAYHELAARGSDDSELLPALPALNDLRDIRGGYADRARATPLALTFGLYQGAKMSSASISAYYRGLHNILLPRLLARLENQMRSSIDATNAGRDKSDTLYEQLKVYLILGHQGPIDDRFVHDWFDADFQSSFPAEEGADAAGDLIGHVDALVARPLPTLELDGPLVQQARDILNREPLADYSYNRIMRSARIRALPEWIISDNAGPGAARVFLLRSGKRLNTGIPGIYTWSAYHNTFLPLLPLVTKDIAEDSWVLDRNRGGLTATIAATGRLRRDVLGLYLDDYVRRWDALLADVAIKPFGNMSSALDELNLLSAPDSPLRDLMQAVDSQTQLSRTGATDAATAKVEGKLAAMGSKAAGFAQFEARSGLNKEQNEIASVLGEAFGNDSNGKPIDPAARVDAHFKWVHDFVNGADGAPPGLEAAISKIQAMYQNFSQVANAPNQGQALLNVAGGGGGGGGGNPAAQLQALSKDVPPPIAAMLQTVSKSGAAVASNGASQELQDGWRSKVLPLCQEAFNRYPFLAGSDNDVPADDFAHLLGPGGLIDQFFNDNLKPFVDTSFSPWRWQSADQSRLTLSAGTLVQFERAAKIRDGLFAGGAQMSVRFSLAPLSLDPGVSKISLDIAGQPMSYDHGPTQSNSFQWPSNGRTLVRVTMIPASGGNETVIEKDGPWALLRLLDSARVVPSGQPDRFTLIFSSAAGQGSFQLNASSVRNPFTMGALRSFRCPAKL
jgi:type VI secretion system protein ImpL